jgi:shikimate kinase
MRIFIIGFMGSGKTTFGRKLAKKLGYRFADTDKLIEQKLGLTIPEIFSSLGQQKFRDEEQLLLDEFGLQDDIVYATGGGLPCFSGNIEKINELGISVYMQLTPEALYSRLATSGARRPLLEGKQGDALLAYITKELQCREQYYLKAKIVAGALSISPELVIGMLKHFG